jgi:lysyl-tRNA synthetase class I
VSKFPDRFTITSDFSEIEEKDLEGSKVSVGFRPSGELHVANLLTLAYSAAVAEKLDLELDLFCCDTDWSAPSHEHTKPDNNDVMKLFYNRDCPCGTKDSRERSFSKKTSEEVFGHENLPEHRVEEIQPFLEGLKKESGLDFEARFLTELTGEEGYVEALRKVLTSMEKFDGFFGGGFRRRYRSPVTTFCDKCGFSHAKGCNFSRESDELVASCRNRECGEGFMSGKITERIGVHYLVDPVRDPSRDAAVHVFGGDYRDAKKEQKTSKVTKVAKITELANGETPAYFLGPMIADEDGKPLSKSAGTGKTVSEIDDLEEYGRELYRKVQEWLGEEKKYLKSTEL